MQALSSEVRKESKSVAFNPQLQVACKSTLEKLEKKHPGVKSCQHQPQGMSRRSLDGKRITCLVKNRMEVESEPCRVRIREIMERQSDDLRWKPGMESACKFDLQSLCPGVEPGNGRQHNCLRMHFSNIKNKRCKELEQEVKDQEAEDVLLNPRVSGRCRNEVTALCPDVERGELRIMACLTLHSKDVGFTSECRDSLQSVVSGTNATKLAKVVEQEKIRRSSDIIRWLEGHRWTLGAILVTYIAIMVITFSIAGICWHMKKKVEPAKEPYTVVVAEQMGADEQ